VLYAGREKSYWGWNKPNGHPKRTASRLSSLGPGSDKRPRIADKLILLAGDEQPSTRYEGQ
jgi:hypothetical protein